MRRPPRKGKGCSAGHQQGLALHHDDVEVFVLQTEGRKRWSLHAPVAGFELPTGPSADLSADVVGPPLMDVILEASAPHPCPHPVVLHALLFPVVHSCFPSAFRSKHCACAG